MSNSYTSKKLAFNNAEQFKESFYEPEPTTIGYVFLGNSIGYTNEDTPNEIADTVYDEKDIWQNMFAAKKVTGNDVELVVPLVTWTGNTSYREYDDTIQLSELIASNTTQNLKPMYVMTSTRDVYLCLSNNYPVKSTVEPTGKNLSANGNIQTADNYLWKYLYNIKPTNKFLSNTWIPVPSSTAKLDYDTTSIIAVDGELNNIKLITGGSGYVHSNIFVTSFTTGCTILSVANTANLAANMSISGTGIAGGSFIRTIDTINSRITISTGATTTGGGANNLIATSTRIYIEGDGTSAIAIPVLTGNQISEIVMTTYGKNYNRANISFFGTGTNATARAILAPKFGHGFNSAKELGASNVMISMRIGEVDATEGGVISTDTSFRQYGLLRDPYKYGQTLQANNSTSNTVISQTTNISLIAGSLYNLNEFVYQGISSDPTFSGYVHAQTSNEIRLIKVKGTIAIGSPLKGLATNPTGRTVVTATSPEFEPFTGDVLYVENITKTQRTEGQAESLKFVIRF
jgi:hypothetical protein